MKYLNNPTIIFSLLAALLGMESKVFAANNASLEKLVKEQVPSDFTVDADSLAQLVDSHPALVGQGVAVSFHEESRRLDFTDLNSVIVSVSLSEIEGSSPPNLN